MPQLVERPLIASVPGDRVNHTALLSNGGAGDVDAGVHTAVYPGDGGLVSLVAGERPAAGPQVGVQFVLGHRTGIWPRRTLRAVRRSRRTTLRRSRWASFHPEMLPSVTSGWRRTSAVTAS